MQIGPRLEEYSIPPVQGCNIAMTAQKAINNTCPVGSQIFVCFLIKSVSSYKTKLGRHCQLQPMNPGPHWIRLDPPLQHYFFGFSTPDKVSGRLGNNLGNGDGWSSPSECQNTPGSLRDPKPFPSNPSHSRSYRQCRLKEGSKPTRWERIPSSRTENKVKLIIM